VYFFIVISGRFDSAAGGSTILSDSFPRQLLPKAGLQADSLVNPEDLNLIIRAVVTSGLQFHQFSS